MSSDEDGEVPRVTLARWLEYVEFAIDAESERQRVDTLLELAESIETAWLAACDAEQAS